MLLNDGYVNIRGPRHVSMLEKIDNVTTILKFLAIDENNALNLFSDDSNFSYKLIMDRDLNLLTPMKQSEFIDGEWRDTGHTYICQNNISWNQLLELADEVSKSDEWEKIKLIVAGSKVINSEIRRGTLDDGSDK